MGTGKKSHISIVQAIKQDHIRPAGVSKDESDQHCPGIKQDNIRSVSTATPWQSHISIVKAFKGDHIHSVIVIKTR